MIFDNNPFQHAWVSKSPKQAKAAPAFEKLKKSWDDDDDEMNFQDATSSNKERPTILVLCLQIQTTKTKNVL